MEKNGLYDAKLGAFLAAALAGSLLLAGMVFSVCIIEEKGNLCRWAVTKDVWKDKNINVIVTIDNSYLYTDGTICMDGRAAWRGSSLYVTEFQLVRASKDSSYTTTLNAGIMEKYNEWSYMTRRGQAVLLANNAEKVSIIVEGEKDFIVVNVLGNLSSDTYAMSNEMLEDLADVFDFAAML